MKISDIYKKYGIPPNLQEHMLRVYAIVSLTEKHWVGKNIDWKQAKKVALLHDLGNIVKFDFDQHPEFLGDEQKNVERWKKVQKKIIDKYGSDDHKATEKMLEDIGMDKDNIKIILKKSFGNSVEIATSDNWILKLLYYGDLRTLPFGIGTLEERIDDVKARMPKYTNRPDFKDLVQSAIKIEKQILKNLNISKSNINNSSINQEINNGNKFLDSLEI